MAEQINVRELFLRNFVIELIKNSRPSQAPEFKEIMPEENKIAPIFNRSLEARRENLIPQIKMAPAPNALRIARNIPQLPAPSQRPNQIQIPIPTRQSGIEMPPSPTQIPSLSKLNPLIKDPTVTEIECSGANESLLVKKAGIIQKTQLSLTKEEINNILNEFSQKTKIPIIEGTFKAAFDSLILIAVISDILGPRFIIQKKNPFQPLFE